MLDKELKVKNCLGSPAGGLEEGKGEREDGEE